MPFITWEDAAGVLFVRSSNLGMEDIKSCPLLIGVFYFCLPGKILKVQFCFTAPGFCSNFTTFLFICIALYVTSAIQGKIVTLHCSRYDV